MSTRNFYLSLAVIVSGFNLLAAPAKATLTNEPSTWTNRPLSMTDALNLGLQQNGAVLRGRSDLEAQFGVVVQTRAVALPRLQASGNYQYTTELEELPPPTGPTNIVFGLPPLHNSWNGNIQLVQTIYQGGQITSSLRSAKLTRQEALLNYETVIADALLSVRLAYYDVLLAAEQVGVEEASVKLLTQELDDQTRRFDAGTVPRFNVLRANVELGNERPVLIRAQNDYRVAKSVLVNRMGFHVAKDVLDDVPVELTDKLDADPYTVELQAAIAQALQERTELLALRKAQSLREEGVISARSGYKPTVQVLGGYGAHNAEFVSDSMGYAIYGWSAGAQVSWNLFDGLLTQGRIDQAKALYQGSQVDFQNKARDIELEVRTDYSNFIEAREVLASQEQVVAEAEEALRLASARSDAGTGTQLDVLSAQTSLTQARSTQARALHDYDAARARLERAIGLNVTQTTGK